MSIGGVPGNESAVGGYGGFGGGSSISGSASAKTGQNFSAGSTPGGKSGNGGNSGSKSAGASMGSFGNQGLNSSQGNVGSNQYNVYAGGGNLGGNVVISPAANVSSVLAPNIGTGYRGPMSTWGSASSVVPSSLLSKALAVQPASVTQSLLGAMNAFNTNKNLGISGALGMVSPYAGMYGFAREPFPFEVFTPSASETYLASNPGATKLGTINVSIGDLKKAVADGTITDPKLADELAKTKQPDSMKVNVAGFVNDLGAFEPSSILGNAIYDAGSPTDRQSASGVNYGISSGVKSKIAPEAQAYAEGVTKQRLTDAINSAAANIESGNVSQAPVSDVGLLGDNIRMGSFDPTADDVMQYALDNRIASSQDIFRPGSPVESGIASSQPGDKRGEDRLHAGLDFSAATGTPVTPSTPGTVISKGTASGYGPYADVMDIYGNVQRYAVHDTGTLTANVGDLVAPGDIIGTVGAMNLKNGKTGFEHLHFENISPKDPAYSALSGRYENVIGGNTSPTGFIGATSTPKGQQIRSSTPEYISETGFTRETPVSANVGPYSQTVNLSQPSSVQYASGTGLSNYYSLINAGVSPEVAASLVASADIQQSDIRYNEPATAGLLDSEDVTDSYKITDDMLPGTVPQQIKTKMSPTQRAPGPAVNTGANVIKDGSMVYSNGQLIPIPGYKPVPHVSYLTSTERSDLGIPPLAGTDWEIPIPREKPPVPEGLLSSSVPIPAEKPAIPNKATSNAAGSGPTNIIPPGFTDPTARATVTKKPETKTTSKGPTVVQTTNFVGGAIPAKVRSGRTIVGQARLSDGSTAYLDSKGNVIKPNGKVVTKVKR